MDSEHRHELKRNELADWIAHFPEYVRKNYMQVIGVILIIIGVFLWLFWTPIKGKFVDTGQQKQAQMTKSLEQVSISKVASIRADMGAMPDSFLVAAGKLETEADEADNPLAKAFLLIKRGEALRSDLHYKDGMQDEAIVASQIEEARAAVPWALVRAVRSVSMGHEAVAVKPAPIMALANVSHADGSLCAKTTTIRPSGDSACQALRKDFAIPASYTVLPKRPASPPL